ncbi:MAG: hypothetical protein KDD64_04595 [Bdellovibrionales bacterium]|nr:hypothetical protein [Bdellovibrionales bacterium]
MRSSALFALRLLLRPIAKFCLKRALTIQDFLEVGKSVFLDVASDEIKDAGGNPNTSRLSVITGIRRKEINRLLAKPSVVEEGDSAASLLTKVIGLWATGPAFTTASGKPRVLDCDGQQSQFADLVEQISTDVRPGTVLAELERIGAVERSSRGVKLLALAYKPVGDPSEGLELLAADAADLIEAVQENIFEIHETANLHATTDFDNIVEEKMPQIRKWLLKEGMQFHHKLRKYLSRFDKDSNPRLKGKGGSQVVVGSFSRTKDNGGR